MEFLLIAMLLGGGDHLLDHHSPAIISCNCKLTQTLIEFIVKGGDPETKLIPRKKPERNGLVDSGIPLINGIVGQWEYG
jgi:hypothetical protein